MNTLKDCLDDKNGEYAAWEKKRMEAIRSAFKVREGRDIGGLEEWMEELKRTRGD